MFAPTRQLVAQIRADIEFCCRLTSGGRRITWLRRVGALLTHRGLWIVIGHRVAYFNLASCRRLGVGWWVSRCARLVADAYARWFCKSEVRAESRFAAPIYFSRRGYCMVSVAQIGANSVIHDHCSFGYSAVDGSLGLPSLGRDVWIGPGSVLIGGFTVGDGATVLPGSVLNFDVPPRAVVLGNPARIVRRDFDNAALRESDAVFYDLPLP